MISKLIEYCVARVYRFATLP